MPSINFALKDCLKNFIGRRNFILVSCFILLSGCAQYQYISVSSHLDQNDKKEFIKENDTVKIKYTFAGENFPINITIYNKLQQPVYIDWQRSVVIINNVQVNDPFYHEGQSSFIAPLSYVTVSSNSLKDQFIKPNPGDQKTYVLVSGEGSRGTKYSYSEQSTPLFFRNVLALTTNEDLFGPTFFDYSFWVSDIIQTGIGPSAMSYNPPNQFYIHKVSGVGKFLGWTAGISALIILDALLPDEGNE